MVSYIIRRLIAAVGLLIVISIIVFAIFYLMPRLAGASPETLANRYVGRAATGATAVASQWTNPNRGQWRHSWYSSLLLDPNKFQSGAWPEIAYAEMRLLAAEALYRTGNLAAAADSVMW